MERVEEEEWLKNRLTRLDQHGSIVEQNVGDGRWIRYDQHQLPMGKRSV